LTERNDPISSAGFNAIYQYQIKFIKAEGHCYSSTWCTYCGNRTNGT